MPSHQTPVIGWNGGFITSAYLHWRHFNGQEPGSGGVANSNYENGVIIHNLAFDVDSDATLGGVPVGEFYLLSSSNDYGGIAGTPKKNLGID